MRHFLAGAAIIMGMTQVSAADLETLAQNLRQDILKADPPDAEVIDEWLANQAEDGHWPDMDYERNVGSAWGAQWHIRERGHGLAEAYAHPESPYQGDEQVLDAIIRALEHWHEEDYRRHNNWWENVIAVPREMVRVLLLVGDDLPEDVFARSLERVAETEVGRTGQNRVWQASIVLMRGVVSGDLDAVREGREAILEEIEITTDEGLQRDFSFHQHGPQMMNWAYGQAFIEDGLRWWALLEGTSLAMPGPKRELLQRYLEALRWSAWRGWIDLSARGRTISRGPFEDRDSELRAVFEKAMELDPENRQSYEQMLAFNFGDEDARSLLVGHRYFWRSDYAVHRRSTWYASVRMHSSRTFATETFVNDELPQGHHLADGALFLKRHGGEYHNIQSVWNWRRIPGVTFRDTTEPFPVFSWAEREKLRGHSELVGGVSDGQDGVAAMELRKEGVEARKAWFFSDVGVVALGAGIGEETGERVLTTVNQCMAAGPVTVGGRDAGSATLDVDQESQAGAWVHHDGVGYLLLDADSGATAALLTQSGVWSDINPIRSDETVEREVFSLWIDHGQASGGGTYAYVMLPDVDRSDVEQASENPPVEVVANEPALQAVAMPEQGHLQAVFYEAGRLDDNRGNEIRVSDACLVMLKRSEGGWDVSVADPTQGLERITIQVNGESRRVRLPGDDRAGESVTFRLE